MISVDQSRVSVQNLCAITVVGYPIINSYLPVKIPLHQGVGTYSFTHKYSSRELERRIAMNRFAQTSVFSRYDFIENFPAKSETSPLDLKIGTE